MSWLESLVLTHVDIEVAMFAGDDLHAGHDVVEQLDIDLLREGLRVGLGQGDVQQLHKRLDRATLQHSFYYIIITNPEPEFLSEM